MQYTVISADSHVNEPPDLFRDRVPAKFRDRAPYVIDTRSGANAWVVEDREKPMPLGLNTVYFRNQKRFDRFSRREQFENFKIRGVRFDDVLPGSFDPKARIAEIDEDKVDAEILFNGAQLWPAIKAIKDRELSLACFRAYNDWIAEYEGYNRERLVGTATIPATGIDDAVAELQRCSGELGIRGATLESYPSGTYEGPTAADDRFWAIAEERGIPVNIHLGFGNDPLNKGASAARLADLGSFQTVATKLILDGVFDRFPRLKFVGVEVNCGWIPYFLEQFDDTYRRYHHRDGVNLELLPSEYFHRNLYVTFILDRVGLDLRYLCGIENIMWSSDFPHSASNWPVDTDLGYEQLAEAGATKGETDRIMWRTVANLYHLAS